MMIKKYIIKEQECGYLMKDGRFVELLTAGRYSYLNMLGTDSAYDRGSQNMRNTGGNPHEG